MADVSVRPARAGDVAQIAAVQLGSWRTAYARALPAGALDGLDDAAVEDRWREAVTAPPTPLHRVLVALEGARVVGLAAAGPAEDPDLAAGPDPAGGELVAAAEIYTLAVAPDAGRRGHGSRLLAAVVDHLRGDGAAAAVTWVLAGDGPLRAFLGEAGWAPDGAHRELDMGAPVAQLRLHTDLTPG